MKYIILLVAAILVFPILMFIVRRKKISNRVLLGIIAGLVISFIGLVMQSTFDSLYVLAVMFGLAFAVSVLLDKRSEPEAVKVFVRPEVKDTPHEIIKSNHINANEELAASVNMEVDFAMEPIEDDLNHWMSANREETKVSKVEFMKERSILMGNKGFLNTFIIVLAATFIFYGFSSVGALALTNVSSKDFGDQTYVGPFDISKQKEQAVKEKLKSDFITLQTDFAVNLTYQDITVALPPEVVTFDVEKTVDQSNSGEENPIVATVSVDGLRTVLTQQFSSIPFTEDSIQSIATGIERELETGIMPLNVHITDYSDFSEIEIATSSIAVTELSTSFMSLINALNGTEIASFATFSLFDFIKSNNIGHVSDEELTVLASVLYSQFCRRTLL